MFRLSLFAAVALTLTFAAGAHFAPKKPGSEPYTPTRLEWLEIRGNSHASHFARLFPDVVGVRFVADHGSDTIKITVVHLPQAEHRIIKATIDGSRGLIDEVTKKYGWSGWVKIVEDVRTPDEPTK